MLSIISVLLYKISVNTHDFSGTVFGKDTMAQLIQHGMHACLNLRYLLILALDLIFVQIPDLVQMVVLQLQKILCSTRKVDTPDIFTEWQSKLVTLAV